MDYEKAYKDALERARKILEFYKDPAYTEVYAYAKEDIPSIFPELAVSEDERIRKAIIKFLKENKDFPEDWIAWLEKQGEQKPAWSNGDDEMILDTIRAFQLAYPYATEEENPRRRNIDWLKSLKDRLQPHWKPTEEQLQTLEETIEYDAADANVVVLRTLYNDLKKL